MGNDISQSTIPPPTSINDCVVDGELDLMQYYIYKRRNRRQLLQSTQLNEIVNHKRKWYEDTLSSIEQSHNRKKKKRSVKKRQLWIRGEDRTLRTMNSNDTVWFKLYIEPPILSIRMQKLFCHCFRLCHQIFLKLLNKMHGHKLFEG